MFFLAWSKIYSLHVFWVPIRRAMISSNIIFLSSTLDTGRKARFTIDIMAATLLFIACWSFWNNTDDYKRPRYGRGIHTYTRVHHLTSQLSSGALSHQFSLPPCLRAAGQFSFSFVYLAYWIYVLPPFRCYTVFHHILNLLPNEFTLASKWFYSDFL